MSTLKIKRENGKIFCPLADSWHIETPEEKVRQEYIKILVENYGYSLDQMAQEIKVNNSQRGQGKARADIVIWKSKQDKIESKAAFIVVESLHDEIKEKLVAIGELLGFDSRSEVKITTGAVVDAVWEAKIGNMGKAIYVFEVQSKGSIDSLILNLKKAQSNAAVQAVVAVADEEQLAKIIRESAGVIDEKSLRTWDSEDVLAVYDSLVRAHESINKLALVPESF